MGRGLLTLEEIMDRDRNGFGPLRLLAALAVVYSHSFYLTSGDLLRQPLLRITGYSLGQHAVHVFFVMSGVMVTASLMRPQSIWHYLVARALRVFPGLLACVVLTAFVLGPLLTSLPLKAYLHDPQTYLYVLKTAGLATGAAQLPGVFAANPLPGSVNIPVWTLKYEVMCYLTLALLSVGGLLRSRRAMGTIALVFMGAVALLQLAQLGPHPESSAAWLLRLTFCFAMGVAAYGFADRIPLTVLAVATAFSIYGACFLGPLHMPVSVLFAGCLALWLAQFRFGWLGTVTGHTDLSYGIYIYGWVLMQVVVAKLPGLDHLRVFAMTLAALLPTALASWLLIERPALLAKERVANMPIRYLARLPYWLQPPFVRAVHRTAMLAAARDLDAILERVRSEHRSARRSVQRDELRTVLKRRVPAGL